MFLSIPSSKSMAGHLGKYIGHFAMLGAVCAGYLAFVVGEKLLSIGLRTFRRSLAVDPTKFGRWAVVAGCTQGIGRSYAIQLAEKGMHIALVSKNVQTLFAVAQEIHQHSKATVRLIWADFDDASSCESVKTHLSTLDIGILVNNVDVMYNAFPEYFCEGEAFIQKSVDLTHVNMLSCVLLTNIVLPGMLQRKRGIIINIGSGAGLQPLPFYSLYSATKAFVHFFTAAINMEYSSQGVMCQLVMPNMVNIGKPRVPKISWSYPGVDEFVRKAIQTIGREPITSVHWPHELEQITMTYFLMNFLLRRLMKKQRKRRVKFTRRDNMPRSPDQSICICHT